MRRRGTSKAGFALVAAFVAAAFAAAPASADTFRVTRTDDPPPNGCAANDCSLREAVLDANANAGGDTINLRGGLTYRLSIPGPANTQGDLDVVDDVIIQATGNRGRRARLEARGVQTGDRAFDIAGATVRMSRLVITGGHAPEETFGMFTESRGGAIVITAATLTFVEGAIVNNRTTLTGGNVGFGGGIFNNGILVVRDSRIAGNDAGATSFGGGIHTVPASTTTLVRTTLQGNEAIFGGGMTANSNVAIRASTIAGNDGTGTGGGIFGGSDVPRSLTIENSTLSGNISAGKGGAIRLRNGIAMTLNNATISDNTASSGGVAPFEGGAISLQTDGGQPSVSMTIANTILAANTDTGGGNQPDCHQEGAVTITSLGHNVIGNENGCTIAPATGDQIGTAGSPIDPLLGPLANNGGPTPTQRLRPGSPALNNGSDEPAGSSPSACLQVDQRGVPRTNCDVGAYELVRCQGAIVNRVGTGAADSLLGTQGRDGILGFGRNDQIAGRGGNDAICAGGGDDVALGGRGNDRLLLGAGDDLGRGVAGNDRLRGGPGRDRLLGGRGNDRCSGGPGRDRIVGCE